MVVCFQTFLDKVRVHTGAITHTGPRHPVFLPAGRQSASPVAGGTPCICWLLSPGAVAGAGPCPLPELPPCEPACPSRACLSIQAARDVPPRPRATPLSPELHVRLPLGSILGRVCLGGGVSQGPPHSPREGIPYVPPGLPGRPPCNPLGPKLQHTLSCLEQGSPAQRSTEAPGTDGSGTQAPVFVKSHRRESLLPEPEASLTVRGPTGVPSLVLGRVHTLIWAVAAGLALRHPRAGRLERAPFPGEPEHPPGKLCTRRPRQTPLSSPQALSCSGGRQEEGFSADQGGQIQPQLGAASSQEFGTRTYVLRWPMAGVGACTLS